MAVDTDIGGIPFSYYIGKSFRIPYVAKHSVRMRSYGRGTKVV